MEEYLVVFQTSASLSNSVTTGLTPQATVIASAFRSLRERVPVPGFASSLDADGEQDPENQLKSSELRDIHWNLEAK